MTDKTKTPRELALEAFERCFHKNKFIHPDEAKYFLMNYEDEIRKALSQAEQPEPIDLEFIPRDLVAHLEFVYPDEWKNLSVGFKRTLRNWLSNKFHNLTKEKK